MRCARNESSPSASALEIAAQTLLTSAILRPFALLTSHSEMSTLMVRGDALILELFLCVEVTVRRESSLLLSCTGLVAITDVGAVPSYQLSNAATKQLSSENKGKKGLGCFQSTQYAIRFWRETVCPQTSTKLAASVFQIVCCLPTLSSNKFGPELSRVTMEWRHAAGFVKLEKT